MMNHCMEKTVQVHYIHNINWGCVLQVIHQFYVKFTGQSLDTIQEETDRDNFLSPVRAVELGVIDSII